MIRTLFQYLIKQIRSFMPAFRGMKLLAMDHKFYFHLPVGLGVFAASWALGIPREEWLWVVSAVFAVWMAEGFNTAIERTVDLITPVFHEPAGRIKDMAAAVVVMAVLYAGIVGCLVLIPRLWQWIIEF